MLWVTAIDLASIRPCINMPNTISTILVMGPPASGKSDFVKLLAGPVKLKPNATTTDELRSLAISPYFSDDGDTIRLIKFPGFNHRSSNPTDAELLIDLSVYLEGMRRRQEPISGIIYTHRIDDDGLNGSEVARNLKMLRAIAGDQQQSQALQNVVIVTTNWDKPLPAGVDRNAKETDLQGLLTPELNISPDQSMRHDGSKWSALRIVNIVKGKTPTPLYIQTQLESDADLAFTKAAEEMVDDINTFIRAKRAEDDDLRVQILRARRSGDRTRATTLTDQLTQLGPVLDCLRAEAAKLQTPVDWDQASRDNAQLEGKITEMRDLATTDWKAEYERVKNEADNCQTRYNTLMNERNTIQANYTSALSQRDTLQANYNSMKTNYDALASNRNTVSSATTAFDASLNTYRIRATTAHPFVYSIHDPSWPDWPGYSVGEILNTNGVVIPTRWGNIYRVRNSSGRVGVAYASYFTWA